MTDLPGHAHVEAFRRMKYEADDGSEHEVIWNARDGVTPFVITLRSGKQARHVEWNRDEYAPDYKPQLGERIFVDLTRERARAGALRMVQRHPQYAPDTEPERANFIDKLAAEYFGDGHAPDLIEVTG